MNIKVYKDRKLLNEDDNFGSENENLATTLIFEFPEYVEKDGIKLATKDLNKTIIFNIEGDNELPIIEDKFSFPYDITKLGEVEWNIALKEKSKTEDMTDKLIWYSETMTSKFGKSNEGHNEITTEKLDAFNVVTTILNEKISEVDVLKVEIGDFKQALENKVDKEKGKGLSTNDFTNILKEKLENLENYNDTEIRNLLNGSFKNVSYTANNGMLIFTKNDGSEIKVDLPLELLIESGRYDEANSQIVLVLANGNSINIPVSDLLDDFYGKSTVDEMLEERDEKIADLETENKSQAEKIERLEKENAEQQKQIESLEADYNPNTLSGEVITITDGRPKSKIKADVNGNSYQETTEGYQLVDFSKKVYNGQTLYGVLHTYYDDGSFELDGTATSSSTHRISNIMNKPLKANTTYTMFVEFLSGSVDSNFSHLIQNTDTNTQVAGVSTNKSIVHQFTPTEDIENWCYGIYHGTSKIFSKLRLRIMLVEGAYSSISDLPFEPYTGGQASPNTEYEQDVEVITEVSLVQRGKNVIQTGSLKLTDGATGITITKLAENKYLLNGTTVNQGRIMAETFNKIAGKQMTFTAKRISGTATGGLQTLIYTGKDLWNQVTNSLNIQSNKTVTANLLENDYGLNSSTYQLGFFVGAGAVLNNVEIELQLEYGEVSTEIELPQPPIIKAIDLQGNSIAKVGDIKDLLKIGVDGSVGIKKKNIEIVFDGVNNKFTNKAATTNNNQYRTKVYSNLMSPTTNNEKVDLYCNYFKTTSVNSIYLGKVLEGVGISAAKDINFGFGIDSEINTLELANAWLQEHNVKIIASLVENYYESIPLPSIEPITLFEGTNVFELVTNLGTTMSVTYKISNKSLEKRISALEKALIGG